MTLRGGTLHDKPGISVDPVVRRNWTDRLIKMMV